MTICEDIQNSDQFRRYDLYDVLEEDRQNLSNIKLAIEKNRWQNTEVWSELFKIVDRSLSWINGRQSELSQDTSFNLWNSLLSDLWLAKNRTNNTMATDLSIFWHLSDDEVQWMWYMERVLSWLDKKLWISDEEYLLYSNWDLSFLEKVDRKKRDMWDAIEVAKSNRNIKKLRKMSQRTLAENIIAEQDKLSAWLSLIKDVNTKQKMQIAIDSIPSKLEEIYNNVKDWRKADLENNKFMNFLQWITPWHEEWVTQDLFYSLFPTLTPWDQLYEYVIKINWTKNNFDATDDMLKQIESWRNDWWGSSVLSKAVRAYDYVSDKLTIEKIRKWYFNAVSWIAQAIINWFQQEVWSSIRLLWKTKEEYNTVADMIMQLHPTEFWWWVIRSLTQQATWLANKNTINPVETMLSWIFKTFWIDKSSASQSTAQSILESVRNSKFWWTWLWDTVEKYLVALFSWQSWLQETWEFIGIQKRQVLSYMDAYRMAWTTPDEMLALSKQLDKDSRELFALKKAEVEWYQKQSFQINNWVILNSQYWIWSSDAFNRIKQLLNYFWWQPLVAMLQAPKVILWYWPAALINMMKWIPVPRKYLEIIETSMRNMAYSYIIGEKMMRIKDGNDFKDRDPLEYMLEMLSLLWNIIPAFSMVQANSLWRVVTNTLTDISNWLSNQEVVALLQEGIFKEIGRVTKSINTYVESLWILWKTNNMFLAVEKLLENVTNNQNFLYEYLPWNNQASDILMYNNDPVITIKDWLFSTEIWSIDYATTKKLSAQWLIAGTRLAIEWIPIIQFIRNLDKTIDWQYNPSKYRTTTEQIKLQNKMQDIIFKEWVNTFVNDPLREIANMSDQNSAELLSYVYKTVEDDSLVFMVDRWIKWTQDNRDLTSKATKILIENWYMNLDWWVELEAVKALRNTANTNEAKKWWQINALAETNNPWMWQILLSTIATQLKSWLDKWKLYSKDWAIREVWRKWKWIDTDWDGDLEKVKWEIPSEIKKQNEQILWLFMLPLLKSTNQVKFWEVMKKYLYLERDRLWLSNNIKEVETKNKYKYYTFQDDNGNDFNEWNYWITAMLNIQDSIRQWRDPEEVVNLVNTINTQVIRLNSYKKKGMSDEEISTLQDKVDVANVEIMKYNVSKIKTTWWDPYLKNIAWWAILVKNLDVLERLSERFDSLDEESKWFVSQAISEVIRTSWELKMAWAELADSYWSATGKRWRWWWWSKKNSASSLISKLDDLVKTSSVPYTTLSLPKPDDFRIKFTDRDYNYMRSYASSIGSFKAEAKSEQYDDKPKSIKYNPQRKYNIWKRKSTKSKKPSKWKSNSKQIRVIA